MTSGYSFAEVKKAAAGQWPGIAIAAGLAPEVLDGRHHPCPGCGGRDRFRFIDDKGDGFFICNGGGDRIAGDGFQLLQHVLGMSPSESLRFVAGYLGIKGQKINPQDRAKRYRRRILKALAYELDILRIAVADHLAGKTLSDADRQRERLAATRVRRGLEALHGG